MIGYHALHYLLRPLYKGASRKLIPRTLDELHAFLSSHLGAKVAPGGHLVCIITLRAPADLADQAELELVDVTEHQLLLEEALWV